jgi:hypothetical protein
MSPKASTSATDHSAGQWAGSQHRFGNRTAVGGLEKCEGNPLPERYGKDRKQNGYEKHNGQEQG